MTEQRALILDFGGVLTTSLGGAIKTFEAEEDLPEGTAFAVLADGYREAGGDHPIVGLETGALSPADFEVALAAEFGARGYDIAAEGLIGRLLGRLDADEGMWTLVATARRSGVRTALLSNSWGPGTTYPQQRLAEVFDVVVISAEVGLRKPDPAIFALTSERLDVPPERCVFVDDHDGNVRAAEAAGMAGIHHRDTARTAELVSEFLGIDLRDAVAGARSTPPRR